MCNGIENTSHSVFVVHHAYLLSVALCDVCVSTLTVLSGDPLSRRCTWSRPEAGPKGRCEGTGHNVQHTSKYKLNILRTVICSLHMTVIIQYHLFASPQGEEGTEGSPEGEGQQEEEEGHHIVYNVFVGLRHLHMSIA